MPGKKLGFVDSTLRDGQEALLGGRLRTELVTPILESLDEVGFQAVEAWGGGTFRASLALLHEDPWERLRVLKKKLKRTPVQILLRGRFLVGDRPFSYEFVKRFLSHTSELGVEVVRLYDPLNNFESLTKVAQLAKRVGLKVQLSLLCSSDRHNLNYFRSLINPDILPDVEAIGLFDPWGTLPPAMVGKIVKLIVERMGKRVFVHLHNIGGLAVLCSVVAQERGASIIDSCFAAFDADGSLPSIETLMRSFADEIHSGLNIAALVETSNAFERLRRKYFDNVPAMMQPITPLERSLRSMKPTSSSLLTHQGLGESQDPEDKLRREIVRAMNELGLIALVAPVSEIVARQAVLNIHSRNRYDQLTDEFLALLRGRFGPLTLSSKLDDLRKDVNHGGEGFGGKIEEQDDTPANLHKLSEADFLSSAMYPQEFSEMSKVRDSGVVNARGRIIAAALAVLAEEDQTTQTSGKLAMEPKTMAKSASWRYPARLEDSYSVPRRAFIEEPF